MKFHENRLLGNIIPYFCRKLGKMSQYLSSAAVVTGALRVNRTPKKKNKWLTSFILVILFLHVPLIQEELLSVTSESMCTKYWLIQLAKEKVWLGELTVST